MLVHVLTGISAAGVNLYTGNIALKASPHGKATAFLAVNTIVHGVAGAAAPNLGGIVADRLTGQKLLLMPHWLSTDTGSFLALPISSLFGLHSLFFLTAIIGLYAMLRLRAVHEEGEVEGHVVDRISRGRGRKKDCTAYDLTPKTSPGHELRCGLSSEVRGAVERHLSYFDQPLEMLPHYSSLTKIEETPTAHASSCTQSAPR